MKTGLILKRFGCVALVCLLLACVGCNQPNGDIPAEPGTEQPTEQPTEAPAEQPTEQPTEAETEPEPQNLQEFYIDINYDGVYERLVIDPDGASKTEDSDVPSVRLYGELNGKEELVWSYQLHLKSRWTGFAVKGNELYYFNIRDLDSALSVEIGWVLTQSGTLDAFYTRSCYSGAVRKEGSGSPSFHPGLQQLEADRMLLEVSKVAEGTTVLIANVDGEIVYSTPQNKLGSIALPDWIYHLK